MQTSIEGYEHVYLYISESWEVKSVLYGRVECYRTISGIRSGSGMNEPNFFLGATKSESALQGAHPPEDGYKNSLGSQIMQFDCCSTTVSTTVRP